MAKKITGIPVKNLGDKFKAIELNEIVNVVNDNATTLEAAGGGFIARVAPSFSFQGKEKGIYKPNAIGTYGTTGTGQVVVDDITAKSWSLYWNGSSLSGDFVVVDTANLATKSELTVVQNTVTEKADKTGAVNSLEQVFLNEKTVVLTLSNGRYTNISTSDTNTSYRKTQPIPLEDTSIINISNVQSSNSATVVFDEWMQPLGLLTYSPGVDTPAPKGAKFLIVSGLTGNMTGNVVKIKNAINPVMAETVKVTNRNRSSLIDNYLDYTRLIPNSTISNGLVTYNAAGLRTSPMMKLKKTSGSLLCGNIFQAINPLVVVYYDSAGLQIERQSLAIADRLNDAIFGFYFNSPIPAGAVYFRVVIDFRADNTEDQLKALIFTHRENYAIQNSYYPGMHLTFNPEYNSDYTRDIIYSEKGIDNRLSYKTGAVLGDSNSANNNGTGSWKRRFNAVHKPFVDISLATGGATLTSTENLFGPEYRTGGNTLMRQVENLIASANYPDVVFVVALTNDFDLGRHVTPAMVTASGASDYNEYMERTFMTNAPNYNTLIPLQNVNRGMVAGALRYIVERLMETRPLCKVVVVTPLQSTLHNQLNAKRCVDDLKWMAGRLSLGVIDAWHECGMPMLKDYGTDRNFLSDRIHVFSDSGQTRGSDVYGDYLAKRIREHLIFYRPF
ncbi:hypothetical protein FKG96_12460 [Olivibacter sp. LS-1]|uniref:SGNH/GDSL hydrolase family protein n=1 Tax=Olivibacter sp. LS-1 TaxID=2592345 RepID=UPI0011EB0890|nr:hypothetical protein [Olivibacter sp. LS-1]QEL01584.1 hypothetical protein FKG96_12460 [Olivibacter sp. LS-1]